MHSHWAVAIERWGGEVEVHAVDLGQRNDPELVLRHVRYLYYGTTSQIRPWLERLFLFTQPQVSSVKLRHVRYSSSASRQD